MTNESGLFTIKDILFNGNQDPNNNAIESPGYQPLTYRDLRAQITSVVKTLNSMGFHRNDRIAVITPPGPETAVVIISVMTGLTVVPLNPQNKEPEFEDIFSHLGIKAIIVCEGYQTAATEAATGQNIPVIELIPVTGKAGKFVLTPSVPQDTTEPEFATQSDIAYILLTSGTTSTSKIVPVTQKQSCLSKQKTGDILQFTQADRCLHIIPYYHGMGVGTALLSVLFFGGTVICIKNFIPSDFPQLLKTQQPTNYSAGPALHQGILRKIKTRSPEEFAGNSLRFIRSTSATLPDRVQLELEKLLGVPMIDSFGMSEAGTISLNVPPKHGSVGIPIVESLRIFEENGADLETNTVGEIVIKGETVFSGYENAPDENKAAFIDGWFRTGDLGYIDDEGYLFITGRKKEMINKGGEKIAPADIDRVLLSHPLVKEAMTFSIRDPVLGEDIAAMVVLADTRVSEEELRWFLLDHLVQFKVPRNIYFVDEIPKTATGKLLRQAGTERYS